MKPYFFIPAMILLFFPVAGCMSRNPTAPGKNATRFAREINASQGYNDNLVVSDPSNATAWITRGNYYNDAFGRYETAVQSYDNAPEPGPENRCAWY